MNPTTSNERPTGTSGEPRLASLASWAVLAASFGLSASTWIALGLLAGFTGSLTLPGRVDVTLRLAWLMPVAVDGYVVVALVLWMSPVPAKVAAFARKNTYVAAGIGVVAQSAYHALLTWSTTHTIWRVVLAAVTGALPPGLAAGAVHMRALIRRESSQQAATGEADRRMPATPANPTPAQPIFVPAARSIDGPRTIPAAPTSIPSTPASTPATVDTRPAQPAPAAKPTPDKAPTPAALAARTTPSATSTPANPAAKPRPGTPSTRPARPSTPATPARTLAPSTTSTPATASDAAQLALPVVSPDVLAKARQIARDYETQHGTPITVGALAAKLKVNSDKASQVKALLNLDQDSPTRPITTVNGKPAKATR